MHRVAKQKQNKANTKLFFYMSPTTPAEVTFCSFDFACIKKMQIRLRKNYTRTELYKNKDYLP